MIGHSQDIHSDLRSDALEQQSDTLGQGAPYSGVRLAEELKVTESTIRRRWLKWLLKVAPESLLKTEGGYTELTRTLFHEFAKVEQRDRKNWVVDAKARYSEEWASAGVIDGELLPDEVGGILALMQTSNLTSQGDIDAQLADLSTFIDQANAAEANLTDQELQAYKQAGVQRGIARFKLETQAELQTLNHLRQQRMQGGQSND